MLKNEFRLIGTVISDYESVKVNNNTIYKIKIEVDTKNGDSKEYAVNCLPSNRNLNYNKSLKGKLVVVYGYIDVFKGIYSLVSQEISPVSEAKKDIENSAIAEVKND